MLRGTTAIAALLVSLTACSAGGDEPPPVPSDQDLRPVAVPTGNGLAFQRPGSSAQALCHALSPQEWAAVVGGPVGRYVTGGSCQVESATARLAVRMQQVQQWDREWDPATGEEFELSGFPVRIDGGGTAALVAVDPAVPAGEVQGTPVLAVRAAARADAQPPPGLVRSVLDTLLPRLRVDGPSVPVDRAVVSLREESLGGAPLIDAPVYTAVSVLCVGAADALSDAGAATVDVALGSCDIAGERPVRLWLASARRDDGWTAVEPVAGLPAHETRAADARRLLLVELADPAGEGGTPVYLHVEAADWAEARPVAESALRGVAVT